MKNNRPAQMARDAYPKTNYFAVVIKWAFWFLITTILLSLFLFFPLFVDKALP